MHKNGFCDFIGMKLASYSKNIYHLNEKKDVGFPRAGRKKRKQERSIRVMLAQSVSVTKTRATKHITPHTNEKLFL